MATPVHMIPGVTIKRGQALRSVHRSVQLARQFRHLRSLRLKGSPAHVSALSSPVARPASGPVIRGPSGRSSRSCGPLSCCLSAARHLLLGHPVLPGNSALLTVGLPHRLRIPAPGMRTHSRVYTFRTRETQTGPAALSTPETAVFTGRRGVRGRRLPPLSGRSLPPRRHNPARDVEVTRHQQGFPGSRPSGLSPRLWPPWLGRRPLGSSASFAPSRSGTGHARHGGDRSNTNPQLRPWHPPDLLNQLTHRVRPRVATPALPGASRLGLPPASPPCCDRADGGRSLTSTRIVSASRRTWIQA